ncbi:unnamed protein product [Danaus chrysippus]|uniref:(African queen) hypothetical protein n=1 Tax=Danaus chrysippus TaxID=151541 RepID=A0A8J2QEH9_9NEOP|nr:unnamed protein product [Danaus chrysippus]
MRVDTKTLLYREQSVGVAVVTGPGRAGGSEGGVGGCTIDETGATSFTAPRGRSIVTSSTPRAEYGEGGGGTLRAHSPTYLRLRFTVSRSVLRKSIDHGQVLGRLRACPDTQATRRRTVACPTYSVHSLHNIA